MREDILCLVSTNVTGEDDIGNQELEKVLKEIFCAIESISQSEYFNASQRGLKPQIKATICEFDYSGENLVEYNSKSYVIYRTYLRNDERIELYLTEKAGAQ